ncbi:hypothetical protein NNO07_23175 [Pseudomonas resinovorans]|uniref:Transmembrane protein n=1 Tax=Metapseudomonas resinovorans TaxID=53412 RepID=A0ABT4YAR5_METRE|nr:hypothetical protein [Pseudomonas resinovorans]MDA8485977.1 hypothetical protein [Pseudomonas resinovorans]
MVRPRRILRISFNPLVLTLSVALGVWLGFIAIGLTTYVGYRLYTADNKAPVAEVFIPPPAPPQAEPEPAPAPPSTGEKRLQKYEENYNAAQRADNERQERLEEQRRLNDAKCQFWTEQYRNAPTEKAKRNMAQECG